MSTTNSQTTSFTTVDVENVMRRITADLVMIASSSKAITETKARDYAHDIELLAKKGYVEWVDITLFDGDEEERATRFDFVAGASASGTDRPGGVRWPQVTNPRLQLVISYTDAYTSEAKAAMQPKLRINWKPTDANTSHTSLQTSGQRGYSSNGFGVERKDFS